MRGLRGTLVALLVGALAPAGAAAAPHAMITAGPEARTTERDAALAFTVSSGGALQSFECSLDGAAWAACTSPWRVSGLGAGNHTAAVRLVGLFADSTPAARAWAVIAAPPATACSGPACGVRPGVAAPVPVPRPEPVVPRRRGCAGADTRVGDGADDAAMQAAAGRAAAALLCLVDDERRRRGLPAFRTSPALRASARRYAADMVARRFFDHVTPDGQTLVQRIRAAGYLRGAARGWALGEVIAWKPAVHATARAAFRAFLASPPHRRLLLSRAYRDAGAGATPGVPAPTRGATFVVHLGRR